MLFCAQQREGKEGGGRGKEKVKENIFKKTSLGITMIFCLQHGHEDEQGGREGREVQPHNSTPYTLR